MSYFENRASLANLKRLNEDECVNNYGYKFIEFCTDNSLLIPNEKLDGSSKVTCKNVSTVDYFFVLNKCLAFCYKFICSRLL